MLEYADPMLSFRRGVSGVLCAVGLLLSGACAARSSQPTTVQIAADELAPQAQKELAVKPKKNPAGPKVVRSRKPTVKASPRPVEVAEVEENVPEVQVTAAAPSESDSPAPSAPPMARPTPVPVPSAPGAGQSTGSDNGQGQGGGIGGTSSVAPPPGS